jgi:phosphoribosylaminoimidazolecarboxamide formyltransferase/IMP cyclohydrolase
MRSSFLMSLKRRSYFAILKHNNACGLASRKTISEAYVAALANIRFWWSLIANTTIDVATAIEINKLFCEVVIAPKYDKEAITIWKRKTESF